MTTQTMTNELTLDQLDTVSGGGLFGGLLLAGAVVGALYVAHEVGDEIGSALGDAISPSNVMADENGNGDYRPGPQNSPNSPPNPFG